MARIRQRVAVSFLIEEVWQNMWRMGSPTLRGQTGSNDERPEILVSIRKVYFIYVGAAGIFGVGVSFSDLPVESLERRIPFSGSNLGPI